MFSQKSSTSTPVEIPAKPEFKEEIPGSPEVRLISPYLVGSEDAQKRLTFLLRQFKSQEPNVLHSFEDTQGQKSLRVPPGP